MRLSFVVNDVRDLRETQSTLCLIVSALERGHVVGVSSVASLELGFDGRVRGHGVLLEPDVSVDRVRVLGELQHAALRPVDLSSCEAVMLRTNPARDVVHAWAHQTLLSVAEWLQDGGVFVCNPPSALRRLGDKLGISRIPEGLRPETWVTRDPKALQAWVEAQSAKCVLKPLVGTRGRDVFIVDPKDPTNLPQIAELLTRDGHAVAQPYLSEACRGDMRVLMLQGEPLVVEDCLAAFKRTPSPRDFRSNIHAGGHPEAVVASSDLIARLRQVGAVLAQEEVFLAGVDWVGDRVLEINVFSPGGTRNCRRLYGLDFANPIVERLERCVADLA